MSIAGSRRSSAASIRSRGRTADILDELENAPNPFTMPSDEEVFVLREQERARKIEERARLKHLKVHEKTTWGTRNAGIKVGKAEESDYDFDMPFGEEEEEDGVLPPAEGGEDGNAQKISRGAKDKESMSDFILKKREMFLVQMSLNTKRDEILKLEQRAHARDLALKESEAMLVADDERFQQFIRENDEQAHEAIKRADEATKARNQRVQEIKQINAEIKRVDAEISKLEDKLGDCLDYREFLIECTPEDWYEAQKLKVAEARADAALVEEEAAAKAAKAEAAAAAALAAEEAGEAPEEEEEEEEEEMPEEEVRAMEVEARARRQQRRAEQTAAFLPQVAEEDVSADEWWWWWWWWW
jgi:hypothetical protein